LAQIQQIVGDATAAFNNAITGLLIDGRKMRVYAPHGTYKIELLIWYPGGTATNNQGIN